MILSSLIPPDSSQPTRPDHLNSKLAWQSNRIWSWRLGKEAFLFFGNPYFTSIHHLWNQAAASSFISFHKRQAPTRGFCRLLQKVLQSIDGKVRHNNIYTPLRMRMLSTKIHAATTFQLLSVQMRCHRGAAERKALTLVTYLSITIFKFLPLDVRPQLFFFFFFFFFSPTPKPHLQPTYRP